MKQNKDGTYTIKPAKIPTIVFVSFLLFPFPGLLIVWTIFAQFMDNLIYALIFASGKAFSRRRI